MELIYDSYYNQERENCKTDIKSVRETMTGKVLFWQWNSFMRKGVEKAFHNLEVKYDIYYKIIEDWAQDDEFAEQIETKLRGNEYHIVFSINFLKLLDLKLQLKGKFYLYYLNYNPHLFHLLF